MSRITVLLFCTALTSSAGVFAQTPPQPAPAPVPASMTASDQVPDGGMPKYLKPETPEQRKQRLGIDEDPGINPDPSVHYWRYGKSYHIEKFDRQFASYQDVDPGSVRPFAFVNATNEVYQQNEKWVWVWVRDVSPEELLPPAPAPRYSNEQLQYFQDMRSEFSDLTPKDSGKTVHFTKDTDGLPNDGSWRNSPAVADMNGDGCPDIIAPPERKGHGKPSIYLGDCKGHWKYWDQANFPVPLDYGNVVAADFNKDGHMDLAFAVHQVGIFVFLGDGKGNFKLITNGLPHDYATRRIAVADVNGDGYPDIIALSEGVQGVVNNAGKIRVFINHGKGTVWAGEDLAAPNQQVAGDWLTVAHLTGEKTPDVVSSSIYMNSNDVIFLADGLKKWKPLGADARLLPPMGYYYANTAGKFASKRDDDAIVSYIRFWPSDLDKTIVPDPSIQTVVGLDRLSFVSGTPTRSPIARWSSKRPVLGMAVGDFDGDGHLDIIYTRYDPREAVILLGDGKGGFTRATVEGLTLEPLTNYDITVADVNHDGKPDIIVMYESSANTVLAQQNGSIQVFLNRGITSSVTEAKK